MATSEIDFLTTDFYKTISFKKGVVPDFADLHILFYGEGSLINNTFADPITFTVESYVQALQSKVADGDVVQFFQQELYSKTDVFGKAAQRLSVYEYTFGDHPTERMPRGICFMQFIQIEGNWRILSICWQDENENHIIPEEYLIKQS